MIAVKLDYTGMLMAPAKAYEVAGHNNSNEFEDWRYEVERLSETQARVACYDEDGEFVGYL